MIGLGSDKNTLIDYQWAVVTVRLKMREDSPGDGSGFLSAGRAPQFARHLVIIINEDGVHGDYSCLIIFMITITWQLG